MRTKEPFFSLLTERLRSLAFLSEGSYVGFGYPFYDRFQFPNPWKPLSASNALGLYPSELCSPPVIEKLFSNPSLHSCAFSQNRYGLEPALQWLPPTGGAVSLCASWRISPGRDLDSLGPFGRPRLSLRTSRSEKRLSSQMSLSLFVSERSYPL